MSTQSKLKLMLAVVMISVGCSSLGMAAPVDLSSASFFVKENFAYPVNESIVDGQKDQAERGLSSRYAKAHSLSPFIPTIERGESPSNFSLPFYKVLGDRIPNGAYSEETWLSGKLSGQSFGDNKSYQPMLVHDVEPGLVPLQMSPFITLHNQHFLDNQAMMLYGPEVILGRVEPVTKEYVRLLPNADGELRLMNMLIYDMPTHHVTSTELAQLLIFSFVMLLVWPETRNRRFSIWVSR